MAMIFPGMDPYLENPTLWSGVHSRLVVYIADVLQPMIRPRYFAAVEERVYVEGPDREIIPDVSLRRERPVHGDEGVAVLELADDPEVILSPDMGLEVREPYINILDRHSGEKIVTVIEVLSPTNKSSGPGATSYALKQKQVRDSDAHLVEIDLLRGEDHVLSVPKWSARERYNYDYLVCVNRAKPLRIEFEVYPRLLRQALPKIRVPLSGDDPDVRLDLQAVLAQTYEAGSYRDRIRYQAPCRPPLRPEDQPWADQLIQTAMKNS